MDIALESLEGLQRQLRITLPAITLEQRLDSRLAEVAARSNVPGFRPGKAPLSVLRQRYGQELREEVLEELLKEAFAEAQKTHQLRIAGEIQVEAASALAGLPSYTYLLHFEVFPDIPDFDLSKITLSVPQVRIEEQDVAQRLKELQQEAAAWQPVKRDSKVGDRISFAYQLFDHGKLLDSGERKEFFLGEDVFLMESISKQLLAMRAKESKVLDVTFPKELPGELSLATNPDLSGKALRLQLTMLEVATAQLPPLDDNFAQMLNYPDFPALHEAVRQHLEDEAKMMVRQESDQQLLTALDAMVEFPLPMVLIAEQMQAIFERQPNRKGASLRDVPREEAEAFFAPAYNQVKERLILEKLGEQLQVSFDQQSFRASLPAMFPPGFDEARIQEVLQDEAMLAMLANGFYLRQVKQAILAQVHKDMPTLSFKEYFMQAMADQALPAASDSPPFFPESSQVTGDENDKNV